MGVPCVPRCLPLWPVVGKTEKLPQVTVQLWWKRISFPLPSHFSGFQPLFAEEIFPSLPEFCGLWRPVHPAPPPRPAAGRPAESPYSSSLSSSLLINQSHGVLSALLGLFSYGFPSISSLWQSVVFISLFLMRALLFFFYPTHPIHPIHFPVSFLVILEMALKAFMLSDNLNRNVLIYPEPDAGLSPPNCHQWTSAEHNYHPECVVS